jgi:hypothetical protein
LEEHRRDRVKEPRFSFVEKIRAAVIHELEREIQALSHEVQILRASGVAPSEVQILEAETLLAKAKQIIRGK